ncbi:MAG TPA: DUF418 domain-containing protein [Sphingomicrobium sp.]|nr:DUF418 domain-containing protein [Sphingomicrobium sp.]
MATTSPGRIATLDIVRGVAVMGILAMNIVAFAMPPAAYVNPLAYGAESAVDFAVYALNAVLVDGRMRGLFSFLFGASMLLVIQLAESKDESPAAITFRRLLWLLFFGMLHYYLVWYGDILIGYALVGTAAFAFRERSPSALVRFGVALVAVQFLIMGALAAYAFSLATAVASANPSPDDLKAWAEISREIAVPSPSQLRADLALHLGPWTGIVEEQVTKKALMPLVYTLLFGWETLAYMLFGMAALKSGFLTGGWDRARYVRIAAIGLGIAIPAYVVLVAMLFSDGFTVPGIYAWSFAATVPFRPLMVLAYAALIILLTQNGGWLVDRIAAAGRAAFTNYLGTSILMTGLFYGWGLGLYGSLSRAQLYPVVFAMWALMLLWSKPWLDRFRYGPFEWLWRSLARWQVQPMLARGKAAASEA